MARARFIVALAWASLCLLSCPRVDVAAADADIDCPGPDEPFVTSCSGEPSGRRDTPQQSNDAAADDTTADDATIDDADDLVDDSDLVDEVLEDAKEKSDPPKKPQQSHTTKPGASSNTNSNSGRQDFGTSEPGFCDADEGAAAMHQLKHTAHKLIRKYYDPLPQKGKCAIGTACGFAASRLSLGAANRLFRLAGATWVLSEALHSSGFCEEAQCVPEEARPWLGILKRALIKQCVKVRLLARRVWDQERIREMAQKDEMVAAGFAAGAFVGFVV